jgi:2-dehydro-3-deoxyphosphogluconate aldolase/(4S)-4-hydroxy-2-oxoglutarate aldolase
MARFMRLDVLNKMVELGLVPVFYHSDVQVATQIVAACSRGGAKVVEFTNRGDFAYQVFGELVKSFARTDPEVILGVGSVCDPGTAALYINNGANFVVGPVLNPDVAKVFKVFPGSSVGGPGFVKSVLGPNPWTRIMPTGGVDATRESIEAWFKGGVTCVGIGSKLIVKDLVDKGDFDTIADKVAQVLAWIREVRAGI